jgi:hypothetical protein
MKERIINILGLNRDGILQDKRIPKTKFFELDTFNKEKKRIFTDEISEIVLLAILNEETINISAYKDDQVNYSEIYFIYIDLKVRKNISLIAETIQKNILNPCVLIFVDGGQLLLQVALKRLSKNEEDKQVIEKVIQSAWISMDSDLESEREFIAKLEINNFSFENLYVFYNELARLIYQSCLITITGAFKFYRKLEIAELEPYVLECLSASQEIVRLKAEQDKTPDFGERVAVQNEIIKTQDKEDEAKNRLNILLNTQQIYG